MLPRYRLSLGAAIMACMPLGCSSPREHLYSLGLQSLQRPVCERDSRVILVGPISIPELVDRPQIVLKKGEFEVVINEQQRWASPLKDSLTRLLATDLEQHSSGTRFIPLAAATQSAASGRLTIDIRLLLLDAHQGADLGARWIYRDSNGAVSPLEGDSHAHSDLRAPGYPGLVDALNRASSVLAADIAAALGTSCPQ